MNKEELIRRFKMMFPLIAEDVVRYIETGNMEELIVVYEDGRRAIYDDMEGSLRRVPSDPNNLSVKECRREFGHKLRKVMIRKRWTQTDLAEATGLTQPQICNYLNGVSQPTFYTVDKIAKALGCSIDQLRYIED